MKLFIDIVMKRIYLFNIVAWNYRKKIGFPVCKKENFAGLQAHRKRGKSARASPTLHHTLNEERSARFTAQPLSALVNTQKARLEPAIRDAQKLAQNVFPPWPGGGGDLGSLFVRTILAIVTSRREKRATSRSFRKWRRCHFQTLLLKLVFLDIDDPKWFLSR